MLVFVRAFQEAGAINYLDFSAFDEATMQAYTISIQRQRGIKPAEMVTIMRQTLSVKRSGNGPEGNP